MGLCNAKQKNSSNATKSNEVYRYAKQNIRNFYQIGKVLGTGSFGTVKIGYQINDLQVDEKLKKKFAIKTISKLKVQTKLHLIQRELEILLLLDHPNIIRFYETYEDQMLIHFVMEYCDGGELLDQIMAQSNYSEFEAAQTMQKLFSAMSYVHSKGIAHRDIKPENILFLTKENRQEIKIIDFGLSIKFQESDGQLSSCVGTPLYVAPEVLKGKYGKECDNWSLGCIMYILLCGEPPFFDEHIEELIYQIQNDPVTFKEEEWNSVSVEAKLLIQQLLHKDPLKRITSSEALNSQWFKNNHKINKINKNALTLDVKKKKTSQKQSEKLPADQYNTPVNTTTIKRLKTYGEAKKFKKEALKILLNQLKESELRQLTKKFESLDLDHNGTITVVELNEIMKELGFIDTKKEIELLINRVNFQSPTHVEGTFTPTSCNIKYSEFMAATLDSKIYLNKERLWQLFKYFDSRNNNYLEVKDLKVTLEREGRVLTDEKLEIIFREIDLNKDGKVDFSDFCRMMHQDIENEQFIDYYEQNYASLTKPIIKSKK